MSPTAEDDMRKALAKLEAREKELMEEAAKLRALMATIRRGLGDYKAPDGTLPGAIMAILGSKPLSNGQIRAALKASGYGYSLSRLHVSKTLSALVAERKVLRIGERAGAKYAKG